MLPVYLLPRDNYLGGNKLFIKYFIQNEITLST